MKYLVLLITYSLLAFNSTGQKLDPMIDSAKAYLNLDPQKAYEIARALKEKYEYTDHPTCTEAIKTMVISSLYLGNFEASDSLSNIGVQYATNHKLDSLAGRIWAMKGIGFQFISKHDSAMHSFRKAAAIFKKREDYVNYGDQSNNIGVSFYELSQMDSAKYYYENAIKLFKKEKYDTSYANEMIISSNTNIANLFYNSGKYNLANKYFFRSLKLAEKYQYRNLIYSILSNISGVYEEQKEHGKAMIYIQKAKQGHLNELASYQKGLLYYKIGVIYQNIKDLDSAVISYNKSISAYQEAELFNYMAMAEASLGSVYVDKGEYGKAKDLLLKSAATRLGYSDSLGYSICMLNLASNEYNNENYQEAKKYIDVALNGIKKEADFGSFLDSRFSAAEIYQRLGLLHEAIEYFKIYAINKDSSYTKQSALQQAEMETLYELDKKEQAIALLNKEAELKNAKIVQSELEEANAKEENKRKQSQLLAALIGAGLLSILGVLLLRGNRIKKRNNKILEVKNIEITRQKEAVEQAHHELGEKNKEIMDSINYAKRLQEAILPPKSLVKEWLPQSFILYKPKDIVAGDFYWMESINNQIYFAAADCTGHGVPGAMVSVVCSNALSKSLLEEQKLTPAEILNRTRELVIERFGRSEEEIKDGMDVSLCALNLNTGALQWSGANNPLWILRHKSDHIEEIKADKQPIGKYGDEKPFTNHRIQLQQGDIVYLFSDGYPDQFGGEKGKKFKSGNLKKLFLSIKDADMQQQRQLLSQEFESWRGELEQIDDVCVIGVKF